MSILTSLGAIKDVLVGPTPANAVYLGSVRVWMRAAVLRATKTGTQGGTGTGWLQLSNLGAANTDTVMSGGNLMIPTGYDPYQARIYMEVPHTGGVSPRYGQCRLVRAGTVLAEGAQVSDSPGTSFVEWTGVVNPGDVIEAQWRGEGNLFTRPTAQAGAYIEISPA